MLSDNGTPSAFNIRAADNRYQPCKLHSCSPEDQKDRHNPLLVGERSTWSVPDYYADTAEHYANCRGCLPKDQWTWICYYGIFSVLKTKGFYSFRRILGSLLIL